MKNIKFLLNQRQQFKPRMVYNFSSASQQEMKPCSYNLPHPFYSKEQLNNIEIQHKEALNRGDKFANFVVNSMRAGFDYMSGYKSINPFKENHIVSETLWVNRVIFLETVAAVPGFVAGMHRHLSSLRKLRRDNGWIHTLLEEAENERIHLLTFLEIKKPNMLFRTGIVLAQFNYVALFGIVYFFYPRLCHRIVGYLEEQAVLTYTVMIDEINSETSTISHWKNIPASKDSILYWNLPENATRLDVVKAIRKDEEHHAIVNHKFGDDFTQSLPNPYKPGE